MTYLAKKISAADLYNENFNYYFTMKLNAITADQRALLPQELSYKIFKRGTEASAGLLNMNEKMWILSLVFKQNITIIVDDPADGLDVKEGMASLKAQRGKMGNGKLLEYLQIKSAFVLGDKELMSSVLYMAHVCCSSIYQLAKKHIPNNIDHARNRKFMNDRKAFLTTLDFLKNYEATKRRISSDYGLTMPEWYALIYFATKEGFASDFYDKDFKYSYNSNRRNLHVGMKRIADLGYLQKRHINRKDKYTITAKGVDILGRIFNNILLKI